MELVSIYFDLNLYIIEKIDSEQVLWRFNNGDNRNFDGSMVDFHWI
jgi:hypothetical protein